MFKDKVLDFDLYLKKSISECVSPAKIISTSNTLKSKLNAIDPINLDNSQDLTCFFISGFKSKTQVNSPTYRGFSTNPSLNFIKKDELDSSLKSYKLKVFTSHPKTEDHKKGKFFFFEPGQDNGSPQNSGKMLNKKQENLKKIQFLLETIKIDQIELKNFFHDFSDFKILLQESLMEVTKQFSEKRKNLGEKDQDIKVFSLKNQNFKDLIYEKFEETVEKLLKKIKSGGLVSNQKISQLKLEIFQKNQKIQKALNYCAELDNKNKQLEQLNEELKSELDIQYKENSSLVQKYLKTFRELCSIKRTKSGCLISKNEENEAKIRENQELKMNLEELEGIIEKLTKNTGFTQLKQENNSLNDQLKDLTIKFNTQSEKLEKILKTLQESKPILPPRPQTPLKNTENLSLEYTIIREIQSLPLNPASFNSYLPKLQKFVFFLESVLNFRLNKHKSFIFPSKILDCQQIPTRFIEKTYSYLQFLLNFSSEQLKNNSNWQSSEAFIKELEYLIFSINEKHFQDTQKMFKEFKEQEDLFQEEILTLKHQPFISNTQLFDEEFQDCREFKNNENLAGIKSENEFVTPRKDVEMVEFEAKIQELSESAKKYKEKSTLLKNINKELECQNTGLISELREFQFNQKIS